MGDIGHNISYFVEEEEGHKRRPLIETFSAGPVLEYAVFVHRNQAKRRVLAGRRLTRGKVQLEKLFSVPLWSVMKVLAFVGSQLLECNNRACENLNTL
jgi:hypothetical protein